MTKCVTPEEKDVLKMSVKFKVPNMKCEGCVAIIRKNLSGMGYKNVKIDLETKKVEIPFDEVDIGKVRDILGKVGYPPVLID